MILNIIRYIINRVFYLKIIASNNIYIKVQTKLFFHIFTKTIILLLFNKSTSFTYLSLSLVINKTKLIEGKITIN